MIANSDGSKETRKWPNLRIVERPIRHVWDALLYGGVVLPLPGRLKLSAAAPLSPARTHGGLYGGPFMVSDFIAHDSMLQF
jgi:hypothetical protein